MYDDKEVPWIPVKSQRNADGTESHVWEKWVAFSEDPMYLALFARAGSRDDCTKHGHYSPHAYCPRRRIYVRDRLWTEPTLNFHSVQILDLS